MRAYLEGILTLLSDAQYKMKTKIRKKCVKTPDIEVLTEVHENLGWKTDSSEALPYVAWYRDHAPGVGRERAQGQESEARRVCEPGFHRKGWITLAL